MREFSWDQKKSDLNFATREFDFAFAIGIFAGWVHERVDLRQAYGERRIIAVGIVDRLYLTVVYTDRATERGTTRRIISARPSSRKERREYEEAASR